MNKHMELLGLKVRDQITGYEGVVESVSFELYGCVQLCLRQSMKKQKDDFPEGRWFDAKRVEIINRTPIMLVPDFDEPEIGSVDKPARMEKPSR